LMLGKILITDICFSKYTVCTLWLAQIDRNVLENT
jgi:hypothetical protein